MLKISAPPTTPGDQPPPTASAPSGGTSSRAGKPSAGTGISPDGPAASGAARSALGRLWGLGDPKLGGLVGLVGLVLALVGVVIAFLSWRGDEQERSAKPVAAPSTPATAGAPPTPSVPVTTTAGVPATASGSPVAGVPATSKRTTPAVKRTVTSSPKPAVALSYRLEASPVDARTVKVVTDPTGQPVSGLTYWFMVEVDWGDGNIEYYPRRRVGERAETFDISIPADAPTSAVRTGRVYALDRQQSADAEVRLARQSSTATDDFFAEPTGRVVSGGERLPF